MITPFLLGLLLLAKIVTPLDQSSYFRVLSLCYGQLSHGLNLQGHCWSELFVCPSFLSAAGIKCPDKSNSQEECLILTHSFMLRSITAEKPQWRSLWQLTTAHWQSRAKTWMQPCSLLSAQPTSLDLSILEPYPCNDLNHTQGGLFTPYQLRKSVPGMLTVQFHPDESSLRVSSQITLDWFKLTISLCHHIIQISADSIHQAIDLYDDLPSSSVYLSDWWQLCHCIDFLF